MVWGPGFTDPITRLKNPKDEKKAEPADLEAGFVGFGAELLGPDSLLGSGEQERSAPGWHCTLMGWGIGATGGSGFGAGSSAAEDVGARGVPEELSVLSGPEVPWGRSLRCLEVQWSLRRMCRARSVGGRTAPRAWEVGRGHGAGPRPGRF